MASVYTEATPFFIAYKKAKEPTLPKKMNAEKIHISEAVHQQSLCFQQWCQHVPALAQDLHMPLLEKVAAMRASGHIIYPAQKDIFCALQECLWDDVRVVILGQDPYHGAGQAHGLAFSVQDGVPLPRSLRNIFREIETDMAANMPCSTLTSSNSSIEASPLLQCMTDTVQSAPSGNLTRWVKQGVVLLNTVLTVEEGKAHSHAKLGWDAITRSIIESLGQRPEPIAFLLWGRHAADYATCISAQHLILTAAHPSPLSASRGFFGCRHFSKVNDWLVSQGRKAIVW